MGRLAGGFTRMSRRRLASPRAASRHARLPKGPSSRCCPSSGSVVLGPGRERPNIGLPSRQSHVERMNLTVRMQLRRFTRLTSGFSKKLRNLRAAVALFAAWFNFCRPQVLAELSRPPRQSEPP
jgi:hypothetical protein